MKNIFYIIISIALFTSCTEKIDLDLNTDDNLKLVVEGALTTEVKEHLLRLSTSTNYYDDEEPPAATGAVVTLNDGVSNISLIEKPIGSGLYYTPSMKGEVNKKYTLQINYNGKLHETTSVLRDTAAITGINYEECEEPTEDDSLKCYTILLSTNELPGKGDFYMWKVYKNGESLSDTIKDLNFSNDDIVDGKEILEAPIEEVEAKIGDTIKIEQYSINKEDYDFFLSVNLSTVWRGGLFDTPPANIFTAISNGGFGYFITSGFSSKEIIIKPL